MPLILSPEASGPRLGPGDDLQLGVAQQADGDADRVALQDFIILIDGQRDPHAVLLLADQLNFRDTADQNAALADRRVDGHARRLEKS